MGYNVNCIDCRRELLNNSRHNKKAYKVFLNPDLAKFQPRELISELRARGYTGNYLLRKQ